MLTDTILKCTTAISRKNDAQKRKQADEDFTAALGKLDITIKDIKEILSCMSAMQAQNISTTPIMKSTTRDDLLSSANDCGRESCDGTLSITTVNIFASHVKTARTELELAWAQDAVTYSDGPKGYLSMIGGLTDDPQAAKDLESSIATIISGAPSPKKVTTLVNDVTEAQKITSSFSLKPEVEVFLKKVSAQKATVVDLTPEVLAWLKEKNLQSKLKILF